MDGLSFRFNEAVADVVCEALFKWCHESHSEPDQMLMNRAINLYNRGNDTSELLFMALHKDLLN